MRRNKKVSFRIESFWCSALWNEGKRTLSVGVVSAAVFVWCFSCDQLTSDSAILILMSTKVGQKLAISVAKFVPSFQKSVGCLQGRFFSDFSYRFVCKSLNRGQIYFWSFFFAFGSGGQCYDHFFGDFRLFFAKFLETNVVNNFFLPKYVHR
jgi:hypothetical protein